MTLKRVLFCTGLILFMLFDTSCKKWLDLQPIDGITREEFWKTKEDLGASVTGTYASLLYPPPGTKADAADGSGRPVPISLFLWGELRGDLIAPTEASATQEQKDIKDIVNLNILPTNLLVTWSNIYRTINYCNTVIDFAPAVKNSDPTLSDAQLHIYLGEVLAIRSLMYFYLTRTFGDVPLKLKSTSKDSELEDIGKTEQQIILQQIIADLKQAEEWLPEKYGTNVRVNKGRMTKLAVSAILADVYLWMENYSECLVECTKVTDYAAAHPAELRLLNPTSLWGSIVFEQGSSPETIFEFAYRGNTTVINNPFAFYFTTRFVASSKLLSPYFDPDPADVDNVNPDVRIEATFSPESGRILKLGTFNNYQVYRYADVLLMKAEAYAYSNNISEALTIIKDLRLQRKAAITTARTPDPTSTEELASYILDERAREFAFEGKRWFDLLRYARKDNYSNLNSLFDIVAGTIVPSAQQSAIAKLRDINSHYLPINQLDIFADTKLVQNPFYK